MTSQWKSAVGRVWLLAALAVLCAFAPGLHAQSSAGTPQDLPSVPRQSAYGSTSPDRGNQTEDTELTNPSSQISLSAPQIMAVLSNRPEVIVELKDLMAETLQGGVQADTISDEMLYNQIVTDKEFRQRISMFLRARGYVTDADAQRDEVRAQDIPDRQISAVAGPTTGSSIPLRRGITAPDDTTMWPEQETNPYLTRDTMRTRESLSPFFEDGDRLPLFENRAPSVDANNITSEPPVLRRPTPYNLSSLRDLYTQIPESAGRLKRFGSDVFTRRDRASFGAAALDVPIGPDYVIGPGDTLTIDLWGGVQQTLSRVVAVDGHVSLPEAGDVQIAGLTLGKAQTLIQGALSRQYRDVQVLVTLSQIRYIRVYLVGDVQRPGAYEVSALASPLSVLYAAGGPTATGSLRILKHYRGESLLGTVDLYDFLLRGVRDGDDNLQAGDTLVVPPAGPQVAVWGAIKRPAIYELKEEGTLDELLEDAGGVTVAASLEHISVERIDANQQRETISLGPVDQDRKALASFAVRDGDRIHVAPIAPYSERVVYLEGHVVRPGRQPFRDGMHLSDILQSYQDLLPEPATMGEIVRLVPPDLHVQTIEFNVPDVLIGNGNLPLQPFDTIRVLGRYDVDAPSVEIRGEVLRPGTYPLSEGMTAAQLVRMAGGFKRDALLETADLISYQVVNGTKIESQRADVRIGDAVDQADATADRNLKPGDVLTIHQITGWNDIGASITIEGEVAHPGSYSFLEGERLSDLLRRAGGFRETAYPAGAVLIREQVRELEEKSRIELIRQIETSADAARLSKSVATADQSGQARMVQDQQDQILARLKSQPATGRLVIHITNDIDAWAGTPADIEVRRGDVLRIPKRPGFVLVSGQVYNTSAITFTPGKTAGWYLQHAGGTTNVANRKEIFVVRANGSVVGRRSGEWYDHDVLSTRLQPGDVVVVPQKIVGASMLWRNLLSTAQIASSIAITAAVAAGI